ncbi:FkbM family methyltransferase [Nostoc sp. PA-18-2419]|uniref:FkbM family methyltransferase n=1 Tax=Nostoc sp. PA-18-2419 TaxID=2575443 RepID=UPI0011088292|nr:FkbM family methyltransferase [Nostoc sp. PA-18-2419]
MISNSVRDLLFKLHYQFKGVSFKIGEHTICLDESLRRWNIMSELAVQEMLKKYLCIGNTFIDIGANFGLHTLYAAKLLGTQGNIFAFEPVPSNLKLLQKNIALTGVKQQVKIVPKAVSNSFEPFLQFYLPVNEVAVTASLAPKVGNFKHMQVANIRLDDYWHDIDLPIQLIKIDVEGAELEVLRGAEKLLKEWKPNLLIEVHGFALPNFGTSVEEFRDFLTSLGYKEKLLSGEHFLNEEYFQAIYLQ